MADDKRVRELDEILTLLEDYYVVLDDVSFTEAKKAKLSTILALIGTPTPFLTSFVKAELVAGVLTVPHNLAASYVDVKIFDNTGRLFAPSSYTYRSTDANTIEVYFSYSELPGTWIIFVKNI